MKKKANKELALFYGILAGDGCISRSGKKYYISITCHIRDDRKFFSNVVIPITEKLRGKKVKPKLREKYGKIELNFTDKRLFGKIKAIGFPVGKKGKRIKIPKFFPKYLWKYVINGLFSTDGCITFANNNGTLYPRIEIQSTAKKLLSQVSKYLIENGLWGHVYKINAKPGVIYRLEFPGKNNLNKFRRVIGFSNPKHEEKFQKYVEIKKIK